MVRHDSRKSALGMRRSIFYTGLFFLLLLTVPVHMVLGRLCGPPAVPDDPQRIVSLAPGVTETLFALGLGPKVVGVTLFCEFPPEVASIPRVAGFSDVNFEAVVRARPDLVALPIDKTATKEQLERLGIPVITLDTRSLSGLMASIASLGKATGHQAQADAVRAAFQTAFDAARGRAEGKPRPRMLFSVMHAYQGLGYITEIHAIGRDGFFNELIGAAGGVNAYQGDLAFPQLSRESLFFLNPDVIVDVIPANEDLEAVRRDWESLKSVKAIRDNRLYLLTDNANTVPGPRSAQTLARLSHALHPDEPAVGERILR